MGGGCRVLSFINVVFTPNMSGVTFTADQQIIFDNVTFVGSADVDLIVVSEIFTIDNQESIVLLTDVTVSAPLNATIRVVPSSSYATVECSTTDLSAVLLSRWNVDAATKIVIDATVYRPSCATNAAIVHFQDFIAAAKIELDITVDGEIVGTSGGCCWSLP